MKIGKILQEKRINLGVSRRKMAKNMGTSPQNIAMWEKDWVVPSQKYKEIICQHYQIKPESINFKIREKNMMNLGQFLTIKREAMKWSRQQIADSFGVSYNTVYQWETGKKPPNKKYIKDICKHYGFSMSELKAQFKDYADIEEKMNETMPEETQVTLPPEEMKFVCVPSVKFTQHAFPLDVLKSRLDLAAQITANIDGPEALNYNVM